jgi:phosphoribosylaminoimidazolecarboxamide formyltransferase/IMP cyclohydrolase
MDRVQRALVSTYRKDGLIPFCRTLTELGVEILSSGGTAALLRAEGIAATPVSDHTGFPEMLDGRVKTLHPVVHGGLLARRDLPEHMAAIAEHGIGTIDLVAVNLYPVRETAARAGATFEDVVEQIDIGGPSMLRSAAKNHQSVWALVDPSDYASVLNVIREGSDDADFRRRLAEKVYAHTAAYDSAIAGWFAQQRGERFPEDITMHARRAQSLRYGENPEQRAAFYAEDGRHGISALRQLGGKELSFNNLLDLEGALLATEPFGDAVCCAIVKHTTPCGIAIGTDAGDAYRKALACDPVSAFGSVIAFTVPVGSEAAESISSLFVECIVAPSFDDEAIEILGRKKNLRVLSGLASWGRDALDVKRVRGGFLVQERTPALTDETSWRVVTDRAPNDDERQNLAFAWRAVASVKSNAIVLTRDQATIGIGAGQMSRVDAAFMAVHKAKATGHDTRGSALGSDAFFPFRDGVEQAAEAGVTAIIQPGGSVRDQEVIAAANERGMTMVFTGRRLFRH